MNIVLTKHFFISFCLLLIFIQIAQIIYFQRSFFIKSYDVSYWKDRYEHSQYTLPLSKRIIGDDGLYAYIGYLLTQGLDPSTENVQAPPVGKYLIGYSILLFKNPVYYSFVLGLACISLFYYIAHFFLKERMGAIFATALFLLDPLFFSQFWNSMLDLTQLLFLFLSIYFLIILQKVVSGKRFIYTFFAGVSLGLFTQSKTAILFPIIFLLESLCFAVKNFKREYAIFLVGIGSAVLFVYTKYFLLGNSLIDFLKLQKYIAVFWLQSKGEIHREAIWQTLLLGKFPHISSGNLEIVSEWWFMWPIISILSIILAWYYLFSKKASFKWKIGSLFILGSLAVYTFIPSYPRYLLIVLPFLYIFSIKSSSYLQYMRTKMVLFYAVLLFGVINATFYLLPKSDIFLQNFYYNFTQQYFHDVYQENISIDYHPSVNRNEFSEISRKALQQATVKAIETKELEKDIPRFGNKGRVVIEVIYKTQDLGSFSEKKAIALVKEYGQWKIIWDWNFLLDKFIPGSVIDTQIIIGKRGKVVNKDGIILAEDKMGYLISANPEIIDPKKEWEFLRLIESYSSVGHDAFYNRYHENNIKGTFVPLLTLNTAISDNEKNKISSFSGVKITDHPSRIYSGMDTISIKNTFFNENETRIYSSHNYHGVKGVEKDYDEVLSGYSGGTIVLKRGDAIIRKILEKSPKNGKHIII